MLDLSEVFHVYLAVLAADHRHRALNAHLPPEIAQDHVWTAEYLETAAKMETLEQLIALHDSWVVGRTATRGASARLGASWSLDEYIQQLEARLAA